MASIYDAILDRLQGTFQHTRLEIVEVYQWLSIHSGSREDGEILFIVRIESPAFEVSPKVARQRMVYHALAEELAGPLHALSLKALAPGEE